ncbi:uncharacterized protein OCT59_019899 [Rhizophagus irregularis]|uniref:uncharacterized protein n=1 Tax=Rhizophagus irregularis TaxID=588596 RepID=UPI000CC1032C|nr:hypothetical protein OCT59_019899 [Rhizophagus irregularis]GET59703.1 hypothetical protein RIR_jg41273.t1 [Rhizophagus irregularis DAOM 181602=DAOM 197198]CAB4482412.1 unnamed protein product [Rhizophagus irregularis]
MNIATHKLVQTLLPFTYLKKGSLLLSPPPLLFPLLITPDPDPLPNPVPAPPVLPPPPLASEKENKRFIKKNNKNTL